MSGGHWDYRHYQMRDALNDVGRDGDIIIRFPKLAQVFRDLSFVLEDITHKLDYDLSGDTEIKDDESFELECLERIANTLEKKCSFVVYHCEEDQK